MSEKSKYKSVFLDRTDTNPNGSGLPIYNAEGTVYGFLQQNFHLERIKSLPKEGWQQFTSDLQRLVPEDLDEGSHQVVIVGLGSRVEGQRFPERDFHVLGSFSEKNSKEVWKTILPVFRDWEWNPNESTSQDTSIKTTDEIERNEHCTLQELYSQLGVYCSIHQNSAGSYGFEYTPRMKKIIELLHQFNIKYVVDSFEKNESWYHNIIIPGNSDQLFTAHHDVFGKGDAANDNSCSIFNLIALKILHPEAYIVLTDAEEIGFNAMYGAKRVAELWHAIKSGNSISIQNQSLDWKDMRWIVNLELTGAGGKRFFYGSYAQHRHGAPSRLAAQIHRLFDEKFPIQEVDVPLSDSKIFVEQGIDSLVLNPLPPLLPQGRHRYSFPRNPVRAADGTMLDFSIVSLCNSPQDRFNLPHISTQEMQEFVEEVLLPIAKIC